MIKRNIEQQVIELLKQYRIVSISGPRQSGKTTLVKHLAKLLNMQYLTFDESDLLNSALQIAGYFLIAYLHD